MRHRVLAAFSVLVAVGCGKDEQHAPLAPGCDDPRCQQYTPPPRQGFGGDASAPPGSGGSAGVNDAGTGSLAGTVGVYRDLAFIGTDAFLGTGTITVVGPTGARASGPIDGSTYSIDGVETGPTLWVGLQKKTGTQAAMDTVVAVPGGQAQVDVAFAQRSVLEDIAQSLQQSQTLQSTRGHVVIQFVDSSNNPVPDVRVAALQGAIIAYDAGSSYTDAFGSDGKTQGRGMAILFNAPAGAFPGAVYPVSYTASPSASASIDVRIAANAVTFVAARVTR